MVIVCIGTPNISGDSVAPIAGEILIDMNVDAYVYGTTSRPITGLNYREYYKHIKDIHSGDTIIAIDSALGEKSSAGTVRIVKGGVKPGGALNKSNPKIGLYGILAQVGDISGDAIAELMQTPFELIESLAKKCADVAIKLMENLSKQKIQTQAIG